MAYTLKIKGIEIVTEDAQAVIDLVERYGVEDSPKPTPAPAEVVKTSVVTAKGERSVTRKVKAGGTRDAVISAIKSSGKLLSVIAHETGIKTETVSAMLYYLRNQGKVKKNADDTWSAVR